MLLSLSNRSMHSFDCSMCITSTYIFLNWSFISAPRWNKTHFPFILPMIFEFVLRHCHLCQNGDIKLLHPFLATKQTCLSPCSGEIHLQWHKIFIGTRYFPPALKKTHTNYTHMPIQMTRHIQSLWVESLLEITRYMTDCIYHIILMILVHRLSYLIVTHLSEWS